MSVSVLDLGVGNIASIMNALRAIDQEPTICATSAAVIDSDYLIVPGVGAFQHAMQRLSDLDLLEALRTRVLGLELPTLGVCLGAQLFFTRGTEGQECQGIDVVSGSVQRITTKHSGIRLPHTGWNSVQVVSTSTNVGLSAGHYYFNHEYQCVPNDPSIVTAVVNYGTTFTAAYRLGSLWGFQFHPEKSQRLGLSALASFIGQP